MDTLSITCALTKNVKQVGDQILKCELNIMCNLLIIYTNFQVDVSKYIEKVRKIFQWWGELVISHFRIWPEVCKFSNHDDQRCKMIGQIFSPIEMKKRQRNFVLTFTQVLLDLRMSFVSL